jgi:hypothetical protein
MPPFRTVHGGRAGPTAVGVLVPPGQRTLVVVRPRSLAVDLVMIRPGTAGFFEADRQTAGVQAQRLVETLLRGDSSRSRVAPAGPDGFHVLTELGTLSLIVCPRLPGQAYRPHVCPTEAEAQQIADAVQRWLCPAPEANQELYTNMSQFERINVRSPLARGESS